MYNLAIRKCRSPPLLAPRLKIFKLKFTCWGSNPGPAEPEADMQSVSPKSQIKEMQPRTGVQGILFEHDNASSHEANAIIQFLKKDAG